MQGPMLTMSAVDTPPFPRSHSSPNILDLASFQKFDFTQPATRPKEELPRSASYTSLPVPEAQSQPPKSQEAVHKDEGSNVPVERQAESPSKVRDCRTASKLQKEERPKLERIGRTKSLVARPKSWIAKVKGSPERRKTSESVDTLPVDVPPIPAIPKSARESKTKTVSESFATFARKSWMTSSRSPSPSRRASKTAENEEKGAGESKMVGSPLTNVSQTVAPPEKFEPLPTPPPPAKQRDASPPKFRRSVTAPQKRLSRPQSVLMSFTSFKSANSSVSSLPTRSSFDEKSTPRSSTDKVPPLPTLSTEKLQTFAPEIPPRRRDESWSAFRSLENEFAKFQSKSWSLKTNVVRSSLLPFLRNHASHPSNKNLRAEDLDRRITILNKWWTGLLEVLDGRQNQIVSGVDRPVLLEACYAIMTRPEWRVAPSQFAPLCVRSLTRSPERRSAMSRKKSAGSISSSGSNFITESVYHNIRNLFIQNLLSQMNFVVDKMSLRHAPASLVTFCGKAAAYAFFFVPGVAEMLVRVWGLHTDTIKRVVNELDMPRRPNKIELDDVILSFPEHIHCLGWSSVKQMANQLRQEPHLAMLSAKINWYGPWMGRWCGRDSDLFFVFAKHYHVLAEEFLPSELTLAEKARAPGFILVQAQILATLDATIHRQPMAEPISITFDDVLAGADATAAALPMPSNNSARPMAENRLIMLLRDFLSERPSDYENARLAFGEMFSKIMQASAKRTSLFDHGACFVLCDFMEESLTMFVRFHHALGHEFDFVDWYFWMDVCKKMLDSENSMSEIRLFSFLFSTWAVITNNIKRKEVICLEWLLCEDTFDKFFNHWCPMVRAYYMRLLCWRLCRHDGDASDLDLKIFSAVSVRIKLVWANFLFAKEYAEKAQILPPITTACHPAPGRRLLIIRNDNQSPNINLFFGFDGIPSSNKNKSPTSASKRLSLTSGLSQVESSESAPKSNDAAAPVPNKKRWTLRSMLPSALSSTPDTTSSDARSASTENLEEARREIAVSRSRPASHSQSSIDSETTPTHRAYCFKFSLEWAQHYEKPFPPPQSFSQAHSLNNSPPARHLPNGLSQSSGRRMSPPRLPSSAQAMLGAKFPNMNNVIEAKEPEGFERRARSKYAGRSLAEWGLVVGECNNFVERRRSEGVPGLKWIEVPTLGVEGFRKFGAGV